MQTMLFSIVSVVYSKQKTTTTKTDKLKPASEKSLKKGKWRLRKIGSREQEIIKTRCMAY